MRTISADGVKSLFEETTGHVWIPAITISGEGIPQPQRLCSNIEPLVYAGNTYEPLLFQWVIAADKEDSPSQAQIIIDNITRDIALAIRQATGQPEIVFEMLRVSPTGVVTRESLPETYNVLSASVDAQKITCTLGFNMDILNEAAMMDRFTPAIAPGLFQ